MAFELNVLGTDFLGYNRFIPLVMEWLERKYVESVFIKELLKILTKTSL